MIHASPADVAAYTRAGFWGTQTVDDLFRMAAWGGGANLAIVDAPDKPAFGWGPPLRLTWDDLVAQVDRLAHRLLVLGLRKDAVVACQLPNSVELAVVYLACARLGLILSPFPIQYRDHELADLLPFAGARAFITARRIRGHDHAAMAAALNVPGLDHVLAWGGPSSPGIATLDDLGDEPLDRAALLAANRARAIDANDIFTLTWTSGTEARPKGVPRSHNLWLAAGRAVATAGALRDGEVLLNPFPMVHIGSLGGMFFPWLIHRGVLVQHQPFDLETFLRQIAEEVVNYTVAPPAVLNLLMQDAALSGKYDLSTLRSVGSGSAPLSPWMIEQFQARHGIAVWNTFGSSEGCGLFAGQHDVPDAAARAELFPRFGVPGIDWSTWTAAAQHTRLVDPATEQEVVEPGQPGELRIKGPFVFAGYWKAPEKNAESFDADGYFRTGDMFEIAGLGNRFYRYLARAKDVINRGGVKISPAELETLIDGHPAVREAAVIGVPDARLGEVVCAVVALRDGAALTLDDLVAWLKERRIAVYKLPQRLEVLPALPRNPVGKVLKRDLRQSLAA